MAVTHRKVACCVLAISLLLFVLSIVHLNSDPMSEDEPELFVQFKKSGKEDVESEEGERHFQLHGHNKQGHTTASVQDRDAEEEDYEGEGIGEGGEAEESNDSKLSFSVVYMQHLTDESANGPVYSGYMAGFVLTVSAVVVLGVAVRGAMFLKRRGKRRSTIS
ncbi:uncharacterized protein LOC118403372 isoform X2 [Branchiostoma floridae]|uniref:Uncharacterized protein LOC118403372 isoform X1 n=1 Tax=Branchiostoma floridae TaxID=7739 RepID=A0A9J7KDR5_BRAFL|nr:uncharacterized protein LOC118403372 isoform X1 [Branchiostoma floridae]XP_035657979.1 uncharacterized protein LOC118403372 isoform X2 [Branchiostoma floridae]